MQKIVFADSTENMTKLWLKMYGFNTKLKAKLLLSVKSLYILTIDLHQIKLRFKTSLVCPFTTSATDIVYFWFLFVK